jgi:hypothetical protein
VVQYLKRESSRRLREEFLELRRQYWGRDLWADGYAVSTDPFDETTAADYLSVVPQGDDESIVRIADPRIGHADQERSPQQGSIVRQARTMPLSQKGSAVYWFLAQEGIASADDLARRVMQALSRCQGWQTNEKEEQDLRSSLTNILSQVGAKDLPDMVRRILTILRPPPSPSE